MGEKKKYPFTKCQKCGEIIEEGKGLKVKDMLNHYCKVEVEWLDAQTGFGNAQYVDELIEQPKPQHTFSVGYLLYECKDYIILGFMLFGEDMVKHNQLIPRGMIKKIRYLAIRR